MDKQITRNAEEQEAFEALTNSLHFMSGIFKGNTFMEMVQGVERGLLVSGYVIVKIPPINPVALMPREVCRDHTPHSPHENCDGNNI